MSGRRGSGIHLSLRERSTAEGRRVRVYALTGWFPKPSPGAALRPLPQGEVKRQAQLALVTQPSTFFHRRAYPGHSTKLLGSQCGPMSDVQATLRPSPNSPATSSG
jgi:hypothetical protein